MPEELSRRRRQAWEALSWATARSGAAGVTPAPISVPGVILNDLAACRAIYKAYFDRSPTDAEIRQILKQWRWGIGATFLIKSVSTARGLAQALSPAPNPVTTPFAVACCASSTATGCGLFIAACEYVYRKEHG